MSMRTRQRLPVLILCFTALCATAVLFGVSAAGGQNASGQIDREDVAACMACHSSAMDGVNAVNHAALQASPHKELKCQDCHSSITAAPHTPEMLKEKASCATCHPDPAAKFAESAHSNKDIVEGDHPTCIVCHGGGDPHAVNDIGVWPRARKVDLCSRCHRQTERMERYKVDPEAVPSYEESFHGKALLRFKNLKVAICTDCHGHHDVLSPVHPAAPTHRNNAAKTCSQSGCHPGAQVRFAMSGANHLRLKEKKEPILLLEALFFQILTAGTLIVLLAGVMLDLRRELSRKASPPRAGRLVTFLVSLCYLFVIITLALSVFGVRGAYWSALAAGVLLGLALLFYLFRRKPGGETPEPHYPRFTVAQRWQHGLLAISFTLLVLTGMPLRFPQVEWLRTLNLAFGGLQVSRLVHRVAAVIMIFTWIWHTLFLLYRWRKTGYSVKAWSMLPNRKDLHDIAVSLKYYFGHSHEEPKYDRFQFREKFDYFAVYWGMPIMVISGLVLWFPIYFGNRLPELGLSMAYIAHSDEAVLAFLTIVLWHFYNTHFHPDTFPMNRVFYTGVMSRSEMEREHPLELERMESAAAPAPPPAAEPASESPPQ